MKRATKGRIAVLLLGAMLLPTAGGCLFEPREAAPPETGETIDYLAQVQVSFTLANLQTAINANHVPGYQNAISRDFVYIPNSQVVSDYPSVDWAAWDYDQELAFVNALFTSGSTFEAKLRDQDIRVEEPSGDQGEWEIIYALTEKGIDGSEIKFRGRAFVFFEQIDSFWYISRWEDVEGAADPQSGATLPTWGGLRGAFASN
jgi:hypothetical protein